MKYAVAPTIELTKMNDELMAAMVLGALQSDKCRTGAKNIPPPIPTVPLTRPMIALIETLPILVFRIAFNRLLFGMRLFNNRRSDARKRLPPRRKKSD